MKKNTENIYNFAKNVNGQQTTVNSHCPYGKMTEFVEKFINPKSVVRCP